MGLTISPRKVRFLGIIIAVLSLAHLGTLVIKQVADQGILLSLVSVFNLDEEANVPTLYAIIQLLIGAGLLLLIGLAHLRQGGRDARYWLLLAGIFTFLAVDESVGIHERLIKPLREALHASGIFHQAWVIPYGLAVLALGVICLRFLLRLPRPIRNQLLLAGALYVGGAVGMELAGGLYIELFSSLGSQAEIGYALIATVEEALELIGIAVLIHTLLVYIETVLGGINLQIAPAGVSEAAHQIGELAADPPPSGQGKPRALQPH
jgi:hypothetical protein